MVYYREAGRSDRFVIVGITPVMLLMDGAASWTFYTPGPDHLPEVKITKPFYLINPAGQLERLPLDMGHRAYPACRK